MQCGWPQHSGGASRTNLTHKYILLGLFFNWLSKFTTQAISHKRLLKTWKNHQTWATWPQSAGAELKLPPYWAMCSSPFSVYCHLGDASSPVGVGTVIPDVSQYPGIFGQRVWAVGKWLPGRRIIKAYLRLLARPQPSGDRSEGRGGYGALNLWGWLLSTFHSAWRSWPQFLNPGCRTFFQIWKKAASDHSDPFEGSRDKLLSQKAKCPVY